MARLPVRTVGRQPLPGAALEGLDWVYRCRQALTFAPGAVRLFRVCPDRQRLRSRHRRSEPLRSRSPRRRPEARMTSASDPVALAQALIRCESVTPVEGGALTMLEGVLMPAGFE